MERIAIFLDLANLEQAFRRLGAKIDYLGLRDYLAEGRVLVETYAYLPINPFHPESKQHFADFLQRNAFLIRSKLGKPRPDDRWKCNFDVEIAVDILRCIQHCRIDIVIIGSGDGDMLPICEELRLRGVRCEIAGTNESAADELLAGASGYIDLGTLIREQREEPMQENSQDANRVEPDVQEIDAVC